MSAATSPSLPRLKPASNISWLLIFFIAVATFLIVLLSGLVLFEIIFSIRVLPGVSVWGIDLGGQTIDQASATIDARLASSFNSTPIDLADADQVYAPTACAWMPAPRRWRPSRPAATVLTCILM